MLAGFISYPIPICSMCSPRCMTRHGYQPYVYTVKIRISLRPKSEPQAWFTVHAVPFAEGWGRKNKKKKKNTNLDEGLRSMVFRFSLGSLPISFPFLSFPCTEMHRCGYLLYWVRSFVFPCRQLQQRESDKSIRFTGMSEPSTALSPHSSQQFVACM